MVNLRMIMKFDCATVAIKLMSEGMWRSPSEFVRCGKFDGEAFISKRGNNRYSSHHRLTHHHNLNNTFNEEKKIRKSRLFFKE